MCGQWSKVSSMSIPRSSFGVTTTNGRIYCVGGYDGVHFLNTVEKYNPRTDRFAIFAKNTGKLFSLALFHLYLFVLQLLHNLFQMALRPRYANRPVRPGRGNGEHSPQVSPDLSRLLLTTDLLGIW